VCQTGLIKPEFIVGLADVEVNEGGSLCLQCQFSGDPRPQIQWLRNGTVVSPSAVFRVSFNNVSPPLVYEYVSIVLYLCWGLVASTFALGYTGRKFESQ